MTTPTVQTSILTNATLAETIELLEATTWLTNRDASDLIAFVSKASVSSGQDTIELDADAPAKALGLHPEKINLVLMNFDAPFQLRRRGVITKVIVGGEAVLKDETLMRSMALRHKYLDLIKAGKNYTQVAKQVGTTKRMVQFLVEFAFLTPDIVAAVFAGTQPTGLTTQWIKTNKLPKS